MAHPHEPGGQARQTVLLVDDSVAILTIFGELLEPHYNVRAASSGARALEMMASSDPLPDIILLDVMMPRMDGYAVLRTLRANLRHRDVPVILVTAADENENEERGLSLGAVDFISKPVKPAVLLAHVRTHLAIKAGHDAIVRQNEFQADDIQRLTTEKHQLEEAQLGTLKTMAAMKSLFAANGHEAQSRLCGIEIGDTYPAPLEPAAGA